MYRQIVYFTSFILVFIVKVYTKDRVQILAIKGSGSNTFALINGFRYILDLKLNYENANFTFLKLPDPFVIALPKASSPFSQVYPSSKANLFENIKCENTNSQIKLAKDIDNDYFLNLDSEMFPITKELLPNFCKNENEAVVLPDSHPPMNVLIIYIQYIYNIFEYFSLISYSIHIFLHFKSACSQPPNFE